MALLLFCSHVLEAGGRDFLFYRSRATKFTIDIDIDGNNVATPARVQVNDIRFCPDLLNMPLPEKDSSGGLPVPDARGFKAATVKALAELAQRSPTISPHMATGYQNKLLALFSEHESQTHFQRSNAPWRKGLLYGLTYAAEVPVGNLAYMAGVYCDCNGMCPGFPLHKEGLNQRIARADAIRRQVLTNTHHQFGPEITGGCCWGGGLRGFPFAPQHCVPVRSHSKVSDPNLGTAWRLGGHDGSHYCLPCLAQYTGAGTSDPWKACTEKNQQFAGGVHVKGRHGRRKLFLSPGTDLAASSIVDDLNFFWPIFATIHDPSAVMDATPSLEARHVDFQFRDRLIIPENVTWDDLREHANKLATLDFTS